MTEVFQAVLLVRHLSFTSYFCQGCFQNSHSVILLSSYVVSSIHIPLYMWWGNNLLVSWLFGGEKFIINLTCGRRRSQNFPSHILTDMLSLLFRYISIWWCELSRWSVGGEKSIINPTCGRRRSQNFPSHILTDNFDSPL